MHTFTVLSLIVVSVFKYSFGIRILWNLSCTKSLNVLYTQLHSPLNSIRSWTVIRSHNLAERAPVHRIITVQITNIALYSVHLHRLQPPGSDHTCQLVSSQCWPEKTVHWTDLRPDRPRPGPGNALDRPGGRYSADTAWAGHWPRDQ